MNKLLLLVCGICFTQIALAQEERVGLGFYGDIDLERSESRGSYGIQGTYDLNKHHSVQAQVYGRSNYVAVGADYLLSFLDKTQSNFNIFAGGGISEDFISYAKEDLVSTIKVQDSYFKGNLQAAVSYYFKPVQLSVYGGYKWHYNFTTSEANPNHIMLGLRYHLW